jgi:hypothetical protein
VPWTAQRSRTARRRLRVIEVLSVTSAIRRISARHMGWGQGKRDAPVGFGRG